MCFRGLDNTGAANLFSCTDIQWETLATVAHSFFYFFFDQVHMGPLFYFKPCMMFQIIISQNSLLQCCPYWK